LGEIFKFDTKCLYVFNLLLFHPIKIWVMGKNKWWIGTSNRWGKLPKTIRKNII
jgi:hypothetical protein